MRRSRLHAPTLRETPAEAELASHRLLLRGGFVRPLASGVYSMLPLGLLVKRKLEGIIREEMKAIGAQEFDLPSLQPAEVWRESGRWNAIGTEMLRLRDRSGREMCLGMTHEEVFATLDKELRSYRELPAIWYQIARKFRDEPRPRGGLIRLREFTMKDSYSFDLDEDGLDEAFRAHERAYSRIFERCGLDFVVAEASSGFMGGSDSKEFIALTDAGEDWVALAPSGRAWNLDVASSRLDPVDDHGQPEETREFATLGIHTIEELEHFGVPALRQAKTLVYSAQGELIVVMLRGDHQLSEVKLAAHIGTADVRPAGESETRALMGAGFGSLGPVNLPAGTRILADEALRGRRGLVSGANRDGYHLEGIEPGRDFQARYADLRLAGEGELAEDGSGPLTIRRGLELGHIFKLGTRYSAAMNATVQDANAKSVPLVMGSYGIGVERLMAAVAEANADENGPLWPASVAPFEVSLVEVGSTGGRAEALYGELTAAGLSVLWDDRDDRAGAKFADADLSGTPLVLVAGPKSLERGVVELRDRRGGGKREVAVGEAANEVMRTLHGL
jgi:prolyl-tRNA synthetase